MSKIDEIAEKLRLDPIEFRVLNDTQVDPENPAKPFAQRHLIECLRQGAQRFGWSKRNAEPGKVREGRWLVGMGVAAAYRDNPVMKSAARVRLDQRGVVTVETDMTDIGTGSYTIIAQTAAEMMGVPLEKVVVRLGEAWEYLIAGDLRLVWREHGEAVVAWHVKRWPGSRPRRWWTYDAPSPRRRLSGVGDTSSGT